MSGDDRRGTQAGFVSGDTSESDLNKIRRLIAGKTNEQLRDSKEAMELLTESGSDQIVIGYISTTWSTTSPKMISPWSTSSMNTSPQELSLMPDTAASRTRPTSKEPPPLILSGSQFASQLYGSQYLKEVQPRYG
ncbi:MAG: hypothetical protein ACRDRQ_12720 [Pseudonocardiaceae bacterium]